MVDNKTVLRIKQIFEIESGAVKDQIKHINKDFIKSVDLLARCRGKIIIMGIGKSGIIGRKIAATFVSLGVPSIFVHPGDLSHGDLGIIVPGDIILLISYSGESEELKKIFPFLRKMDLKTIIMTGKPNSLLAKLCNFVINTGVRREACKFDLAPTASTTAVLAAGDALALTVAERKGLTEKTLAKYHPGGTIGKKLTLRVSELMRYGKDNPVINEDCTVREALIVMTKTKLGAASVINSQKKLVGYFTDGDLRRKLQTDPNLLNKRISTVMTTNPKVITKDKLAVESAKLMKKYNCDNLPVINDKRHPIGIIDERDLISVGIV